MVFGQGRAELGLEESEPYVPTFLKEFLTLDFRVHRGLGPFLTLRESFIPTASVSSWVTNRPGGNHNLCISAQT